jgi:predicted ATPase/DNA-binding SARP family transcriptional activator
LQLHLLGRFRVERGGKAVRLPTRESRLLLAYLALHPESHAREKVAALFWPEVPDASARASLRNALSTLRRKLGKQLLEADRETVRLNPGHPLRVDALEFRTQATRFLDTPRPDPDAVGLESYGDDLLVDFYDDWVSVDRDALRSLYLNTLLEMTRQMRSQSEYERAIELAQRVLASDRANERAHQHLMFCHAALGDRVAALRQYEACRNALQDELAVPPFSATKKLYDWLREAPAETLPIEAAITNLPVPVTSFVGRQREMATVKDLLASARLLTLTGAGGSGKTRLAIQTTADLLDAYPDGVWWVELSGTSDAELLPSAVAKALGVPEVPNQPIGDTLAAFLRSRRLLLVLDDCEHLTAACARLVDQLLRRCRDLQVLTTSREVLGIGGEHVWAVPPLRLPDPGQALPPARLLEFEAVQLFVGRARTVSHDFTLTEDNAAAVVDICLRLDGLPLAIELAAARVNVLAIEQIATRLDDAFRLLTGGSRTAVPRHQTLRAAMDWSFDLLSAKEKMLLRRLSVFAGGWTLPAAEAICTGEGLEESEIFDLLSRLVEKSLVEVQDRGAEKRFRMLQTVRQYNRERLLESGGRGTVRTRHLDYFLRLLEEADPHLGYMLSDTEMTKWLGRLDPEGDNLRTAVRWSLRPQDVKPAQRAALTDAGLRLLSLQHAFWFARGQFSEGRTLLTRLLEGSADVPTATRAQALLTAGYLACWQGDFAAGRPPLEEALARFRRLKDDNRIAFATHGLGFVALGEGDATLARSLFEESLHTSRAADDQWMASFALHFLAIVLTYQGDHDRATSYFEEGNEIIESLGGHSQGLAFSLFHLGRIACLQGDYSAARSRHEEGLRLFHEAGDRRGIGYSLAGFASLAAAERDGERAARLSGAVASLEEVLGPFLEAPLQSEYEAKLAGVRAALGEERFAEVAREGRSMSLEQAIDYAL